MCISIKIIILKMQFYEQFSMSSCSFIKNCQMSNDNAWLSIDDMKN